MFYPQNPGQMPTKKRDKKGFEKNVENSKMNVGKIANISIGNLQIL